MSASDRRAVLLLAFHFPPQPTPGALRPGRFFKYLPEFGFDPVVITAVQTPPQPNIHLIPAPMQLAPDKRTLEGWGELVLRKWPFPTEQAIFWYLRAARLGQILHAKHKFCAVLSTSPPFNTHLAAMKLKRRLGIPWIADFRDPLARSPFRNYGRLPHLADDLLERRMFRRADAMIGVTDRIVESWKKHSPQWTSKMHLLWNGYDPEEDIRPLPLPERPYKVLLHIGTLYGPRHPMIVLHSLVRLLKSGRLKSGAIQVHLVGGLAYQIRDANVDLLNALSASGVLKLNDTVPRPEALTRMAEADFLMLLDMHDGVDSPAVPAKIFEYIRVGRPILTLTTPESPVERILRGSGVPHSAIYPRDSDAQVDEKLLAFLSLPSDPVPPSDWFSENFDGRRQTAALAQLLRQLAV